MTFKNRFAIKVQGVKDSFHLFWTCIDGNIIHLEILNFISLIRNRLLSTGHMTEEREHKIILSVCLSINTDQLVNDRI